MLKFVYFREIMYYLYTIISKAIFLLHLVIVQLDHWGFSHQKYLGQTKVANRCYRSFLLVKFIIPLKVCPSDIPTVINRHYLDHQVHSPFSLGFFYQMIFLHLSSSLDCLARNASPKAHYSYIQWNRGLHHHTIAVSGIASARFFTLQ